MTQATLRCPQATAGPTATGSAWRPGRPSPAPLSGARSPIRAAWTTVSRTGTRARPRPMPAVTSRASSRAAAASTARRPAEWAPHPAGSRPTSVARTSPESVHHPTRPASKERHMPMTEENAAWFEQTFAKLTDNIGQALLGKTDVIRLALVTMLAEGHLLLEDAPGTGKTALARAMAATVQGTNSRIQFTPDLLPRSAEHTHMYDQGTRTWEFHKGPVFP